MLISNTDGMGELSFSRTPSEFEMIRAFSTQGVALG
jgi:hypothetical protein